MTKISCRGPRRDAQQTRAHLLRAAAEVFGESGYEGATAEAVAVRAQVTRPAVNHYFATKSDLYQAAVAHAITPIIDSAAEKASQSPDLATRISTLIVEILRAASTDYVLAMFMATWVWESTRHPELLPREHDAIAISRAFVRWAVDDAISCGERAIETDVEPVVNMLMAAMWGISVYIGANQRADPKVVLHAFELTIRNKLWRVTDSNPSGPAAELAEPVHASVSAG